MAYTSGNLHLRAGAPGNLSYYYDAGSDSMATVAASGYFNNSDDDLNLVADDLIFCQCTDGDMWLKVSAVSSGAVTTQLVSGEGPWNGVAGSASGSITVPGITELGTGTASAHVLGSAPSAGAKVTVTQTGTATTGITVVTDATGVTVDGAGSRTITLTGQGQGFDLLGVSTTRWAIVGGSGYTLS